MWSRAGVKRVPAGSGEGVSSWGLVKKFGFVKGWGLVKRVLSRGNQEVSGWHVVKKVAAGLW